MRLWITTVLLASGCSAAALQAQTEQPSAIVGIGAILLSEEDFESDETWMMVSSLIGATVGQKVAENEETEDCAYFVGWDEAEAAVYRVGPC